MLSKELYLWSSVIFFLGSLIFKHFLHFQNFVKIIIIYSYYLLTCDEESNLLCNCLSNYCNMYVHIFYFFT
jgi:hypothetical protein